MTLQIEQITAGDPKPKRVSVRVGAEWSFHSLATAIPAEASQVSLLAAQEQLVPGGILLGKALRVADDYTKASGPVEPGEPLTWGGTPVANLLANADYAETFHHQRARRVASAHIGDGINGPKVASSATILVV